MEMQIDNNNNSLNHSLNHNDLHNNNSRLKDNNSIEELMTLQCYLNNILFILCSFLLVEVLSLVVYAVLLLISVYLVHHLVMTFLIHL